MKVLSLFDGMACGRIAFEELGIELDSYDAFEIDKYAIKVSTHNFPDIEEHGDVFKADFTKYEDVDWLIGGSPCTYWSIAQTKNRETTASGMGWELFSQYVRALREAKPKYFLYENNYSMSKEIRRCITETFGFEPIMINSALVSAQNRKRLYWVGIRQSDGTYKRADVEQPEDRGTLLKDVLDGAATWREKSCTLRASAGTKQGLSNLLRHIESGGQFGYQGVLEPVGTTKDGKAFCVTSRYYKGFGNNPRKCLDKHRDSMCAEPVCVASRGRNPDNLSDRTAGMPTQQHLEAHTDGKTNTLTTVQKDNYIAEPIVDIVEPVIYQRGRGYNKGGIKYAKAPTLTANASYEQNNFAVQPPYTIYPYAVEFDDDGKPIKAIGKDGKEITIYEVKDGKITIKGKQYPIKLKDGYYIIRKLTVSECKRLQTVPEWYDFSVISNSQAYKCLGNGWTVQVIMHLIRSALEN